jgi:uncharacterized membrane protein
MKNFWRFDILKDAFQNKLFQILFVTTLFFLISFILHHPANVPNFYSDVVSIYERPFVSEKKVPYIDFNFEYPAISGILTYFVSLLSSDKLSYYVAFSVLLYIFALTSIVVLYKLSRAYSVKDERIYNFCIVSLTFILFSVYSFDWLGILFTLLSLFLFSKGRIFLSALFMGLAIASRLIPIVMLPVLLLNISNKKKFVAFCFITFLFWFLPNSYFMFKNFDGWLETYKYQYSWGVEYSFLIYLFPRIGLESHYISIIIFTLFFLLFLKRRLHKNLIQGSFFMFLAFMLSSYKVPPQYMLMLLPFFVLSNISRPLFHAIDFSNALLILLFFSSYFSLGDALNPESPVQLINLIRQLLLLFTAITIIRNFDFIQSRINQ